MLSYSEHRPTQFDRAGAFLPDRQDWLVAPVIITRDTDDALELSNWHSLLAAIGGEGEDVEVHRFGHWGPGWYEIILIRPGTAAAETAAEIETALADYPVVDESDWCDREFEMAHERWEEMDTRDRIDACRRAGYSIFAARRASPYDAPFDCPGDFASNLLAH